MCNKTYPDSASYCSLHGIALKSLSVLEPGATIREWTVLRLLGKGGFGTVYHVRHSILQSRERALKVLNPEYAANDTFLRMLQTEAITTDRIHHPNVLQIHDVGTAEDGSPFIVMEYVDGKTLAEILHPGSLKRPQLGVALEVHRALRIAIQICSALEAAHRFKIIHRDIKPHNILIANGSETVKVVDFGIAKLMEADKSLTGSTLGVLTPAYASPEQACGKPGSQLDGRSDLYSFGVVLYEMLTGEQLFSSDTVESLLQLQIHQAPLSPIQRRPDLSIPQAVADLTLKALAKDPADRFQTATEMRRVLEQASFPDNSFRDMRAMADRDMFLMPEDIEGDTLRAVIQRDDPSGRTGLDRLRALQIARQICVALDATHKAGTYHGGVQPENIVIIAQAGAEVAKLRIFGQADPHGTIPYCSPEQAAFSSGSEQGLSIDSRTDMYSLGLVLHEMLTGVVPFVPPYGRIVLKPVNPDLRFVGLIQQVQTDPERVRREVRLQVANEAIKVVVKALETDPSKRYASAETMLEALDHAIESQNRYIEAGEEVLTTLLRKPSTPISTSASIPDDPLKQFLDKATRRKRRDKVFAAVSVVFMSLFISIRIGLFQLDGTSALIALAVMGVFSIASIIYLANR
jgi:serine/threonine protein kinase